MSMKDWVKKLDLEGISALAKKKGLLDDVPDQVDEKVVRAIGESSGIAAKSFFSNPLVSYALAAAVLVFILVPVLFFLGSQNQVSLSEIVLSSGSGYYIREGIEEAVTVSVVPRKGDTFYTNSLSKQLFQFGENSLVQLSENTRMTIVELNKNEVKISLESGSLFGRMTNKKESAMKMSVLSFDVSLYSSDSVFKVTTFGKTHEISVFKGQAFGEIHAAGKIDVETFRINQGEQLTIESDNSERTQLTDTQLMDIFDDFLKFNFREQLDSPAILSLSIPMKSVLLKINNKPIDFFSQSITLTLEAGELVLELEKDGYYSKTMDIKLVENEIRNIVVPELIQRENDDQKDSSLNISSWFEKLEAEVVYSNAQNNSGNGRILGFNSNKTMLLGLTKFSVIAMNQDGQLLWEKDFSKSKDIIFDTIPVFYNQKIYIPANYTILVLDLKTGQEINRIKAPGIVSYGYQMIINQDKGYIPYPEGIYVLDLSDDSISKTPFIVFENPSTPLFFYSNFYVSSFIKGEMALFDSSGAKKAEVSLDAMSLGSPVAGPKQVFLGDMKGNLYRFDESLNLSKFYDLENGITALLCTDKILFALTNSGELFSFSVNTLKRINSFILDQKPDRLNSLYKKPVLLNNHVVIGSETGEAIFINNETAELVKSLDLTDSAISTSFISLGDSIYLGTSDGRIIRLK